MFARANVDVDVEGTWREEEGNRVREKKREREVEQGRSKRWADAGDAACRVGG